MAMGTDIRTGITTPTIKAKASEFMLRQEADSGSAIRSRARLTDIMVITAWMLSLADITGEFRRVRPARPYALVD